MNFIEKMIKVCLIVGFVMLAGRLVTAICMYYELEFPTFFTDYHVVSLVILAIGIIGSEIINVRKKKGRA
ncbi:ABC-type multidrug transport system permease subunit [Lysinibacillus parviboronicapiens]|uniref:ABC-type multidrug transport system permease subunit n=2 Tax=Lysinibacillus parviboronicapiens TaxID=436516 RepID=A0ABV2PP05_9BACI|nr:hypothetical protein [Lysinibacillus parviboronicapiens]